MAAVASSRLNHRAENLLAVTETAAMFEPLNAVICDGSTEVFEALETGEPRKMMTQTGRFLHVQVSEMDSDRATEREGKVLMFRDVSDVERAQAEVRANERMLRTLIDHSVNGIIRLRWENDANGAPSSLQCVFANSAAARFLTTEQEDLVGASCGRNCEAGNECHEPGGLGGSYKRISARGQSERQNGCRSPACDWRRW